MKKKSSSALPIQFLETRDAVTKFASLSKPEAYPGFHYLHGFLCAVATTPSQISLAEWSEVLHNDLRFSTAMQEEEVFHYLVPMVNGLLRQISENRLEFPPDVDLGIWASGFDAAHREFKHLWDIILSEIEDQLNRPELGKELWDKLVLAWTALRTPANPEALQMLRNSPQFCAMTEDDFQNTLRAELLVNLRFVGDTCNNLMQVYRRMPRQ